jgi:hypothetical protein
MDTSRIFRLTVPGWAFILFTALQSWIFGKDVGSLFQGLPTGPANIIVGLAAGPVVGLIISAFSTATLHFLHPEIVVPRDSNAERFLTGLRALIHWRSLPELDAIIRSGGAVGWRARRRRDIQVKPILNLIVHTRAPASFIEYTTRRWTMYWMYANTVAAFLVATLLSFMISGPYSNRSADWLLRIPVEVVLLLFTVIGIWNIVSPQREIREIVMLWLYHEARC